MMTFIKYFLRHHYFFHLIFFIALKVKNFKKHLEKTEIMLRIVNLWISQSLYIIIIKNCKHVSCIFINICTHNFEIWGGGAR